MIWAGLGAVFFPVGYLVGERMRDRVLGLRLASPQLYYAAQQKAMTAPAISGPPKAVVMDVALSLL